MSDCCDFIAQGRRCSWWLVTCRETITYYSRVDETDFDPSTGVKVTDCKRLYRDKDSTAGNSELARQSLVLHIWRERLDAAGMQGIEPKKNDVWEDEKGIQYVVDAVAVHGWETRYRLQCQQIPGQT